MSDYEINSNSGVTAAATEPVTSGPLAAGDPGLGGHPNAAQMEPNTEEEAAAKEADRLAAIKANTVAAASALVSVIEAIKTALGVLPAVPGHHALAVARGALMFVLRHVEGIAKEIAV